jgi:hypothetical protein
VARVRTRAPIHIEIRFLVLGYSGIVALRDCGRGRAGIVESWDVGAGIVEMWAWSIELLAVGIISAVGHLNLNFNTDQVHPGAYCRLGISI